MLGLVGRLRASIPTPVSPSGGSSIEAALRQVTHTDCAVVPAEALHEAVRLACSSEEALALVLRHVEENVTASAKEWRRINGSLALLERLLRPGTAGGDSPSGAQGRDAFGESLVGRMWYEAKVETRLKDLINFDFPEDQRVAGVIKRSAKAALRAAEQYLPASDNGTGSPRGRDREDDASEGGCTGGGGDTETSPGLDWAGTGGSGSTATEKCHRRAPRYSAAIEKALEESSVRPCGPDTIGRDHNLESSGAADVEAALQAVRAKSNNLRNAVSALDALKETGTRWDTPSSTAREAPLRKATSEKAATDEAPRRLCWCCLWQRQRLDSSKSDEPHGENEDDVLLL